MNAAEHTLDGKCSPADNYNLEAFLVLGSGPHSGAFLRGYASTMT